MTIRWVQLLRARMSLHVNPKSEQITINSLAFKSKCTVAKRHTNATAQIYFLNNWTSFRPWRIIWVSSNWRPNWAPPRTRFVTKSGRSSCAWMMQPCSPTTRAVSSTRTSVWTSFKTRTSPRISAYFCRTRPCEPTTRRRKITFRIPTSAKRSRRKRNRRSSTSPRAIMAAWPSQSGLQTEGRRPCRTTCRRTNSANSLMKVQSRNLRKRK